MGDFWWTKRLGKLDLKFLKFGNLKNLTKISFLLTTVNLLIKTFLNLRD